MMAFDPLFQLPLVTGLALALLLPLLGCLLRLRDEWLAALGLAHVAGAAALAGLALHLAPLVGAGAGATFAAAIKTWCGGRGNSVYALMILAGWSATLLLAANSPLGQSLAHAIVDGQLYFSSMPQLVAATLLLALALSLLPWLNRRLLRAYFLPEDDAANNRPAWRWQFGFDLLTALSLALATTTIGLMAAFALIFLPPWLAFRHGTSWRAATCLAAAVATIAYLGAFWLALAADQPFGPTLVAVLLVFASLGFLWTPRRVGAGIR